MACVYQMNQMAITSFDLCVRQHTCWPSWRVASGFAPLNCSSVCFGFADLLPGAVDGDKIGGDEVCVLRALDVNSHAPRCSALLGRLPTTSADSHPSLRL